MHGFKASSTSFHVGQAQLFLPERAAFDHNRDCIPAYFVCPTRVALS